jgi:hypothetical protein
MIRSWSKLGALLFVCLIAGGCGKKDEAKKVQVSGKVEMDGKPLADGEIMFVGTPGSVPDMLPVENGSFSGQVTVGQKKVEVRAYKTEKAPKSATAGVTEQKVNYIPKRFNEESALTAEVSESGIKPEKFVVSAK